MVEIITEIDVTKLCSLILNCIIKPDGQLIIESINLCL